jgi:hypothetical protein
MLMDIVAKMLTSLPGKYQIFLGVKYHFATKLAEKFRYNHKQVIIEIKGGVDVALVTRIDRRV